MERKIFYWHDSRLVNGTPEQQLMLIPKAAAHSEMDMQLSAEVKSLSAEVRHTGGSDSSSL